MIDFSSKTILVTGSCGYLGKCIVQLLASLNSSLILTDINKIDLDSQAEKLKIQFPSINIESFAADLEQAKSRKKLIRTITSQYSSLYGIVNNAAFTISSPSNDMFCHYSKQSLDSWQRTIEVNMTAPFHLMRELCPLIENQKGSIVNISSIYGMFAPDMELYEGNEFGNSAAYAASKSGLIQLTKWFSSVIGSKIRVNSIIAGGIRRDQSASFIEKYSKKTTLKRMASEEDIANPAIFLLSDMSSYITGQSIVVDGGWSS